jgi:multidrug resistance efflux pump
MGEVVLLQPVPAKLLFWSLVAAFAIIAAYLALAQYARKETVIGYLAPTAGVAKVFVPRTGIITDVHIRESQIVEEGQPLLTVAIDQTTADGQNVDTVQLATLARQKDALREQIGMQEDRAVRSASASRRRSQARMMSSCSWRNRSQRRASVHASPRASSIRSKACEARATFRKPTTSAGAKPSWRTSRTSVR